MNIQNDYYTSNPSIFSLLEMKNIDSKQSKFSIEDLPAGSYIIVVQQAGINEKARMVIIR